MIDRVTRAESRRNKVDKAIRRLRLVVESEGLYTTRSSPRERQRVSRPRLHTATSESRGIVIAKLILSPASLSLPLSFPLCPSRPPLRQSQDDSAALITPRGWPSSGSGGDGGLVDTSTSVKSLRTFVRGKRDLYRSPNSPLFFAARCT